MVGPESYADLVERVRSVTEALRETRPKLEYLRTLPDDPGRYYRVHSLECYRRDLRETLRQLGYRARIAHRKEHG